MQNTIKRLFNFNFNKRFFSSMDVDRHNFFQVLPEIEKNLASCDFYSIDEEMTGISLDAGLGPRKRNYTLSQEYDMM